MILFPYAKDVDYGHGRLTFTLEFFNDDMKTEVALSIRLEEEVIAIIEDLVQKEITK